MSSDATSTEGNAIVWAARGMTGLQLSIHSALKKLEWNGLRVEDFSGFVGCD